MKEELRDLLKQNPKCLRFLHAIHGFDFESPYVLIKHRGSFTYKTVTDKIKAQMGKNVDYVAALLINKAPWTEYVEMRHYDFSIQMKNSAVSPYEYDITTFSNKKYFEERRKEGKHDVYIVAQDLRYLKGNVQTGRYNTDIDLLTRYRLHESTQNELGRNHGIYNIIPLVWALGNNKHWIRIADYFLMQNKREVCETDILDKSGYPVYAYRKILRDKAVKARQEKDKALIDSMDWRTANAAMYKELNAVRVQLGQIMSQDCLFAMDRMQDAVDYLKIAYQRWNVHVSRCERTVNPRYTTLGEIRLHTKWLRDDINEAKVHAAQTQAYIESCRSRGYTELYESSQSNETE